MADTGEGTVTSARANPHLAQALSGLEDASTRLDQRVEAVADELHDSSEELLGWVDVTRSAAGRWVRWPTPTGPDSCSARSATGRLRATSPSVPFPGDRVA
jgi:hypothetical protein